MSNIEGTFQLDGMLELQCISDQDLSQKLEEWIQTTKQAGLIFTKDHDGEYVTIMPDNTLLKSERLSTDPSDMVCSFLNKLGQLCSGSILSTLRSKEVLEGREIQVIYATDSTNNFRKEERVVVCDTEKSAADIPVKVKVKYIAFALVFLGICIFASTYFINYKSMLQESKEKLLPVDVSKIEQSSSFEKYFKIEKMASSGRFGLVVELEKAEGVELDLEKIKEIYSEADLEQRLILESLTKGYVRIEFFKDDIFLDSQFLRIENLKKKNKDVQKIVSPFLPKVNRISIIPG